MTTGLTVQLSRESGTGGCHGDAGRWRERVCPLWVTWHILQCAEQIIVRGVYLSARLSAVSLIRLSLINVFARHSYCRDYLNSVCVCLYGFMSQRWNIRDYALKQCVNFYYNLPEKSVHIDVQHDREQLKEVTIFSITIQFGVFF